MKKKTTKSEKPAKSAKPARKSSGDKMLLKLYVAGKTPKSVQALANLEKICSEHVQGGYKLEVIDLLAHPTLARGDQILAIPTLVRQLPTPINKIIGDLSDTEKVLVGLNLKPR